MSSKKTKEWFMSKLFNFTNLDVNLDRQTKSASVLIYRSQEKFEPQNFINELETFFNWLPNKLEIASVTFEFQESNYELFPESILMGFNEVQLKDYIKKCQKLCWSQLLLPQTIIWNMGETTDFSFWQLALGSDIRICHENVQIGLDSLECGHAPLIAGTHLLNKLFNSSKIKALTQVGIDIEIDDILSTGLAHFKDSFKLIKSLQTKLSKQSPVARIQYKRSINNQLIINFEQMMEEDLGFILSTLITNDWRPMSDETQYMSPKKVSQVLKSV